MHLMPAQNRTTSSSPNCHFKGTMMTSRQDQFSNQPATVAEIFSDATIDALNSALLQHGISAERVIAVLPVAAQIVANPSPPQFRVLYRAA
jgi:hypothetical protein